MKKTFQRWLAMLLAVLMVMGTLPTSAWAARRDEEFAEQPVISDGDGVTDTLGRHDEGEFPVDPVDPSDPPADLNDVDIDSVTVASTVELGGTSVIVTGKPTDTVNPMPGVFAIAIVPAFAENAILPPTVSDYLNPALHQTNFNSSFAQNTDISSNIEAFFGPIYVAQSKTGIPTGTALNSLELLGNGNVQVNGAPYEVNKAGTALNSDALIQFAKDNPTVYVDGNPFNPNTAGYLPYKVLIGGTAGYVVEDINLPITTQLLKVEILTKDALTKTAFSYAQAGASTSTRLNGEQLFTEVKLTNSTTDDMNVRVTISRDKVTSVNTNYGNKTNITEETTRTIAEQLVAEGLTAPATGAKYTIDKLYGLLENWNSNVNTNNVVPPLQNGDTATTITVTVPGNGGTKTIYVAGTQNSALTGSTATETNKNYGNGLGGFKKSGANYYNFWSSYEIEAECTTDSSITGADHAGIRWEQSPEIEPKVRLVYGEGENKGQPIADRTGQGLDIYNNDNNSADKLHSVVIQGITIPWDETAQCYKLPTGKTVVIGQTVRVDGVVTNQKAVSTENGYIDVPMYQVTVDDDPDGKANNGTKDVLGHYMWDTTVPDADAGGSSVKKVSYKYYPENASVGVYAKKDGFSNWENATNGALTNPAGSSLEVTGDSATTVGGHLTVNSDVAVIAHYMKPITLVTTYNGDAPGNNTPGDSGNRNSDYVFSIEVRDTTNTVVASYTNGTENNITAQTLTNAWLLNLDAGKYRLYINGRLVGAQFDTTTIKEGATGYHFVVEMVGVTPKVANGTDKPGSTLTLTDDLNPARARGDVTVTGANKNTDGSIVLYYPKESSVKVTGAIAEGDTLSGLTYDGADKTVEVTDSTWGVKSVNNNMSVNIRGTKDLVVTFGAATGKVEVTFLKDTLAYVDATREVKLSTASNALENEVTLTAGTTDSTKHIYTNDAVDPAKATDGVFYVFVGNTYVNETVTVTAGAPDPATATVNYYTLTVEADQTKDAGAKVEQSTSAIAGDATKDSQAVVYLKNTVVNIKATESGTNYAFSTWEVQNNKGSAPDPNQASTSVTMTTETHLKAIFTKPKYDTYLKVTLNTNTNVTNDLVSSTDTAKDFVSVTLGTGAGAITATHVGNGVWKAAGVVDATQKDLQWYVTTRAGGPFTANQSAVADRDDPTKFAEIKLYSVSTEDTDYDTAQATMTATGVTGQTRVIVEKGAEITLSVTAATGYDHASPYWKEGTAGKGTVEKAKYTLTTELTAEQTLTPTFTYKATITPTVGTSDAVCDVDTVVLTAKDATNTDTTVGTPTENATSHKWTVSGLPIGETEYAIWVNGHKSDKTVKNTTEQKVPMWTVSAATTTGGTVALTTTDKLSTTMPNGATYTAGWTITATANTDNGYRVADTAWALTSGNTYGTLAATNAASTTLSVTTAIEGNVVATAYFTQQWTVKSYVNTSGVTSTATLTDGTGTGADAANASTKTIDDTEYVKVDFNRSAGEELDGWTLAAGSGSWRATAPTETDNTWTDWATTAPAKTVESFYFKPSANSTITAAVKTKPYPVKIIVKLDDSDLTDKTATVPVVKVNNQTLTYSDGAWTGMFTPGDYALTVGSVINNTTQTLTNIKFSVPDGEGTGTAANLTRTVKYWTVGVETDGHGAATMSSTNPVQSKTVNATTTSATIRVLEGTKVTWADSTPVTNYVFEKWQEKQTDGSYADANPTAAGITAKHTYKALFKQKTGTVTVTVKLDGQKDDKSTDETVHTVKLYQVVDGGDDKLIGTKTGKSGEYSFTGVPYNQGAGKYYITAEKKDAVTGAKLFTSAKNIEFSGDDGGTKTVDAPYFTAIAATEGNGNASINFGGDSGTTQKTDYTDDAQKSVKFVVASGTQVTWQAHEDKANYTFDKWTEDNSTDATRADVTVNTANKTFTAKFKKDAFNTYLYLTVNGDPYGETAADGSKDIKSVKLVTAKGGNADAVTLANAAVTPTYDGTAKVWKAENVKSEGQEPWWRVETVDGGVYYKQANLEDKSNDVPLDLANNKAVVREPLFGVVIERGAGNDDTATYTPTLQAQVDSDPKTRIVTEAEVAATVDLNKKGGYTWSKWLSKQSAAPADTDTLDTTNHGTSTTTTTADGTFTLVKGYTAPATGDDKDLHIKPVYTFTTTIVTKYKTDPTDVTTVQINDGTTTTTVNKETAGTGNHTGRYTASGLDPEKTYTIIVNGFPSTVTCDKNNAGADVDVTIFKVTVEKKDKKNNTLTPDGNAYVKLGANATGASAASVYLPIGAKTTTGETDVTKVNLAAAEKAASPVFRLYNKDVTVDTNPADELLWDAAFTAPAGKTMTAAIATNTDTQTPNNLTIGGDDGMQADVTVTAYFLRQYDLTVSAVTTEDKAATNSEVKLTADPKGLGTVMPGTATGQSVKVTKVDAKTYIKAEYVHGVGEDFKGWSYAEADGDLYSALKEDGTVDTTKRIAPAALTAPGGKENTTVYFVPKTDGAVLKAVVEPAKYTVQVKVNLDNTDYPYNNGDLKVWLYTDETTPKKVTELTYNTTDKAFKGEVYPGTYRVYVNGADLANDPVFTEAAKNISFTADEAEGTVAGGGATGKAKLKKEINYYTVNLKADPAGTVPAQNKISFEAIIDAKPGATTASKIFLAKAAGYNINIYSKVYAGRGATDTVHYRFVDWTETATTHGFADKDAGNTAYKFPAENTLVADTANIDGTQEGKQLTLTANFKEQYKVTVKLGTELASNAFGVQIKNEGDTNWASDAYVYVDKDKSVVINGKSNGGGVENSDSYLSEWTIEGDAATDFGAYDNSYLAGTNNTAAAETDKGYKIQGGKYTPKRDSVLVLNGWQKPLLDSGWVFDKGTGAETSPKGEENGERTSLWTKRDAQETPTKVIVRGVTNASYSKDDFTKGVEYGISTDKTKFTFDVENYLKDLPNGTYALVFEYTLGGENHPNSATREVTNTRNFIIKANKNKLTDVNIQVKDHPGETANPVEATTRNAVEYVPPHKAEKIDYADLTFTWYWSANNPGNTAETTYEDDSDMTAAGAKSAADKANAAAAAKGVLVSTLAIKPTVSNWTKDGNTVANGVTSVTDSMKGGYLFAVVTTPDGSEVSTGAVITNAISVDYDATISVYEDGTDAAHLIQEAQKDHYTVYLWDPDNGNFPADPAAADSKAIPAKYSTTDKKYHTEDSKLNAKKTYHVYVQEVESDKVHYLCLGGATPTTITRTANTANVYYYTVRTEAVSKTTGAKNGITNATAASGNPGETFDATPTFSALTGNNTAIASGSGVLQGSHVKANANKLEGKNVGWGQDYDLTWMNKGATGDFTDVTGTNKVQTSTTAVNTGYEHTQNLTGVLTISGRLTQNTYTIEGDVKDVDRQAGKITTGGGAIATATLTAAAATYNGTLTPTAGGHGAKVAFTVPRAAAEAYTLTATPTDGTSGTPETTMKGYSVPSATAATTENPVKLGEVAAGTTGDDLKNRFTIFVAATELKMKVGDGDNTEGHHNESSNRDAYVSAGHAETWVYANYTAWEKTITVTNTGNTELAVTLVLQKSTDGGTNWTDIYKTGTELGGTGKDTDTNGVQFVGLEDTFNLGLADDNKSKSFKVKVPETLENKDDVKYRFDFVTKDGRGGANPVNGPKMYFNLDLTIEPVTIRRVTTWNDDGTFKVQHHWLKEDAVNLGQPDTDATYNAGGEAHTYAAETLGTGHTIMDHLDKQGDTLDDGSVATNDPTKSDIKYRWYVADADAEKPTINTTTGALTFPGNKGHEVTADVGSNGTAYTPTEADHGKMLYLVAVGQRNATNAVMTPDETRFAETPVPIPYPATITLWENKMGGSGAERTKVKADDKGNYSVWLWDVTGGKTDELDTTDTTGRAIKAEAVAGEDGTYKTGVVLYPDHTYQVWTSAAKTADGTTFYLRNTGITIDSVDHKDKDVDYYLVDVANTTLSQNDYDGKLGMIADNSTVFYNTNDLTGDLKKPSAKMPAKGETAATLDVVNNYVLNNTEVTFGFGDRTLDYDLNWAGGMTAVTDGPTDTVSHELTYKDAPKAAVTTELELRLYDVTAKVNGSMGKVEYFSMVLADGEKSYTFTSRQNDPAGTDNLILGVTTSADEILATQSVVFHLPKAGPYVTKATMPDPSPAKLINYTNTDGSKTPTLSDDQVATYTINVTVTGACSYAANLQGEGVALDIVDNIPTATQIGGVQLEVSNPTATSKTSNANITPKEGGFEKGKVEAVQTIKLYYNSYTTEIPVTLTFSNQSKHDPDAGKNDLQNVKFVKTTCTAKPGGGDSITIDTDPVKTEVTGTAGLEIPTVADGDTAVTKKVTLNIQPGLTVGTTYTFVGTASFEDTTTPANTAETTYTLNVEIVPLPFETVTTADDGSTNGKEYTVKPSYRDAITDSTKDSGADDNTNLTYGTDYTYKWVSSANDVTLTSADLHWDAATGTVTVDNSVDCKGAGKDTKSYTPHPDDQGRKLYLVIYAKQGTNATGAAISLPITQTYDGIVYINNDGDRLTDPDTTNHTDPGYAVQFVTAGADPINGVWEEVETGKYAYVSETGLTPGKEYTVKVSRIPGETTPKMVELSKKLTGTKIGKTLEVTGTTDTDNFTNVTQADYFTVNAVNFINEEYKTGTGETFTATITPIITIGDDHAELANHTPVLSGQSVAAKAPAMADPNGDKAWEQDYTLTWRNTTGNNETITADDGTNLTDATNNAYKGQSATAAIADGAYAYGTVSAKTFIGGRLDQTTYTIVGTIHGPTGNAQQVKKVSLKETTSNVTYWNEDATDTGIKSGKWKDSNNDGKHNNGDEVTFSVVKGTYTVTGYEDANFTIRKVTVEGTDAASTPRNEKTFTQSVEKLTEATRIFDIYLEATGPKLTVNDTENPANEATSTHTEDHKFADNNDGAHYYYKQLTADDVFTLELSNPGNVDLKLKAPEVYKVKTGTDYSDSTKLQNALTAGTTSTVTITNGNGTDVVDTTRTILTFAGLPVANDDVLVGESVSHNGNTLTNAGTITVSKDVYNKDDAIYVVKFASEYLTTDGAPAVTGPTVYYVLDLKVEPLPIKKVTAETDPTKTDGTLRLKDFVATGGNANDGLNSVEVDHDRNAETALKGAKDAGLIDADISYVWYSAPTSATVVAGDFDFDTTGMKLTAQGTAKGLKLGTQTNNGKTYKPSDAEQGLNFYLVAYRTDADKNASEFAVSDGVYAQVTIAMKAYRTGKVNKSDTEATPLLTEVNISTMVGEDKKTSNDDTVTVTGVADNANVLTFNATKTDVTAQDKADDPAAAKWYFKSWAVKPLTGDELDATDTGIETPVAGERLTMNYTATGKATVIGYFDKLPELSGSSGCTIGSATIPETSRTLEYKHHDGSGNIQIWVMPKPDEAGTNKFKATGVEGEDLTSPRQLNATAFEKIAGIATGSMGGDGAYVLLDSWVKGTLEGDMDYVFTFYDMDEGAKAENGYEGYDRSHNYATSTGDKSVTAVVADGNKGQGHTVQVTNTSTDPTKPDGAIAETSTAQTNDAVVTLHANAKAGYVFVGWTVTEGDGTFQDADGKGNTRPVSVFRPRTLNVTVTATFRKGDFTPAENMKTSVYYGDDELQETDGKLVVSVTKDKDAVQNFAYDLATEAELTDYLNGATRPANAYTKDGVGDGTNNTNVVPAWLHYEADATDNTKVNFTVKANTPATGVNVQKKTVDGELKDVEDELVVYLKVTETNTNESKIVPVTIDVVTSQLKIATAGTAADETTLNGKTQQVFDGDAYLALFEAAIDAAYPGEGRKPDHEEKVYYDYFAYTNVYNENNPTGNIVDANDRTGDHAANAAGKNRWDKTDGAANTDYGKVTDGYWTVAPAAFDGTGPNGYVAGEEKTNAHDYVFTFHYTGAETAEDDYNYENASITLTIPALVPEMSLKFADTLHTTTKDGDPKTLLTLTKGTHSGEVAADGYVKNDAVNYAPISLAYANAANRTDEHLTYLDEEPVFHVTLQKIGNLKRVELSAADVDGFKTDLPTFTIDPNETTQTASFDVKLAALKSNPKLWVGTHTIKISAKGYYDDATGAEKYIEATYELSVIVDPKVIATVDVKVTDPETEPTEAKGTTEDGDPVDNKTPDSKGNVPIKDVDVTWKPEPGTPDGKHTEAEVKVEIDPNYVYAKDDPATADNNEDITNKTELTVTDHLTPDPEVNRDPDDGDHVIHITQKIPYLMHDDVKDGSAPADTTGPKVDDRRTVSVMQGASGLGSYTINLGAYGANVYDVKWTVEQDTITANAENGIGAVLGTLPTDFALDVDGAKQSVVLDLSAVDTSKTGTYTLTLLALGKANADDPDDARTIQSTYVFRLIINSPGGGGGVVETCPCKVFYHVGLHGTTTDATVEDVSEGNRPSKVPTVTALDGYAFRGWSLTNPATLKKGEKITLVDPKTVTAKGESVTFYAVIVERPFHEHYVIGYPNGNFGPADNINRASVATIIARAILPDFVEGANYGNPGGYSDVSGHWAESAIAYCSKFDVFKGYTDGTFRPDQPITRQEFATVIARLDGELTAKDIPFDDIDEAGDWALNGIYTSYEKGWVNGYTDGTFKPLNNIRRDEAVKVFNAYLNRGVDADGLADLREYVHTGAASNNTENGVDEYMTWPDVPKGHWAYYEIVEAANDHEFTPDFDAELGYTLPEHWEKCWIDERWRYGDGPSGGDSAAMVSAGFQVWLH